MNFGIISINRTKIHNLVTGCRNLYIKKSNIHECKNNLFFAKRLIKKQDYQ